MKTQIKVYAPKPILIVREISKIAKIESSEVGEYNFYLTMQKQLSDSDIQRINNECGDKIEFLTKYFWYSKKQQQLHADCYCVINGDVALFTEQSIFSKPSSSVDDMIYLGYGKELY